MKIIDNGQKIRITKLFLSLMKEKIWLEEMALKGYRLCKMTMGMTYTFEKAEPARLIYEIDRFDISDSPSLKDIHQKEEFISLANEMGWTLLLHDESMNYYFCKELSESEEDELYNDDESRRFHAEKCTKIYNKQEKEMLQLSIIGPVAFLIVGVISLLTDHSLDVFYSFLTVLYSLFCISGALLIHRYKQWIYQELLMTKKEWMIQHGHNENSKKVKKIFFSSKHLLQYLEQESQNGWQVTGFGALHYTFQYDASVSYTYTLDSKFYVNKRLRMLGKNAINDKRDISNISYDWQLQSVKDAARHSWDFVCAFKNMLILYRQPSTEQAESLNQNHSLPRAGIFCNKYGVFLTGCMLAGGIMGFILGMIC